MSRYLGRLALTALLSGVALTSSLGPARVSTTSALMDSRVTHVANSAGSTWLTSPAINYVHAAGHAVQVGWNPASSPPDGNGNGYAVTRVAPSATRPASCPNPAPYAGYVGSTPTSPTPITLTDPPATAYSAATEGQWTCYAVQTAFSPAGAPPWAGIPGGGAVSGWNSQDALEALPVQIGFVVSSWSLTGNGDGQLDAGDTFQVTFNQPVVVPAGVTAGTDTICADIFSNQVFIATRTATGPCLSFWEAADLAALPGPAGSVGTMPARYAASYTVTANTDGTQTITAVVGARLWGTQNATVTASPFSIAPAALTSQRGAPQVTLCTTGAACLPGATPRV